MRGLQGTHEGYQQEGREVQMSEYDIAIKIAGQLEGSFKNAIKGAQSGLSGLGISGKVGSLALKGVGIAAKATAAGLAAAGAGIAAVGAYSVNVGKEFESQIFHFGFYLV